MIFQLTGNYIRCLAGAYLNAAALLVDYRVAIYGNIFAPSGYAAAVLQGTIGPYICIACATKSDAAALLVDYRVAAIYGNILALRRYAAAVLQGTVGRYCYDFAIKADAAAVVQFVICVHDFGGIDAAGIAQAAIYIYIARVRLKGN